MQPGAVNQTDNFGGNGIIVAKILLGASDAGGGAFSWKNPESDAIAIVGIEFDLTTKSSAAGTLDAGTTATSATTSSDNLIDGLDVNAATGLFNNIDDKGTNGKSHQRLAAGGWVTGSKASGSIAGIAGYVCIHYHRL